MILAEWTFEANVTYLIIYCLIIVVTALTLIDVAWVMGRSRQRADDDARCSEEIREAKEQERF